ncbi:MAG: hypothetical protein AB1813_02370 [Verrucomicrobiota bacterium]
MSPEPNNRMDDLLKAFAKKRRKEAGDPLELHPATRRLLQDEVARTYGHGPQPTHSTRPGWKSLLMFWPRFAIGFSVLAMAGIAIFLATQTRAPQSQLASRSDLDERSLVRMNPPSGSSDAYRRLHEGEVAEDSVSKSMATAGERIQLGTPLEPVREELLAATPSEPANLLSLNAPAQLPLLQKAESFPKLSLQSGIQPQSPLPGGVAPSSAPLGGLAGNAVALNAGDVSTTVALSERNVALNSIDGLAPSPAQTAPVESLALLARSSATTPRNEFYFSNEQLNRNVAATESDRLGLAPQLEQGQQLAARYQNVAASGLAAASRARYMQVSPTPAKATLQEQPAARRVLQSFQLEQNGDTVKVTDEDGSVYVGRIVTEYGNAAAQSVAQNASPQIRALIEKRANRTRDANADAPAAAEPVAGGVTAPSQAATGQSIYNFRVAGTNRSLKQLVSFEGNLVVETNAAAILDNGIDSPQVKLQLQNAAQNQIQGVNEFNSVLLNSSLFNNSRIQGKAVVGQTNQLEINALPLAP